MTKGNWIDEENLLAFLNILAHIVSYDFVTQDWKAIQFGLSGTNSERDVWFEYILPGKLDLELKLAKEEGTSVIMYSFDLPEGLENIYEFLVYIIQDFKLTSLHFNADTF